MAQQFAKLLTWQAKKGQSTVLVSHYFYGWSVRLLNASWILVAAR